MKEPSDLSLTQHSFGAHIIFAAVSLIMLSLVACSGRDEEGRDTAQSEAMQNVPAAQNPAQTQHSAEGTLNSIDQAAGTVNISHGPVASASWPAMTMTFKLAEPRPATDLAPGQRVEFRFTIERGMSATVTEIKAVE